jgi:hypothetical protein
MTLAQCNDREETLKADRKVRFWMSKCVQHIFMIEGKRGVYGMRLSVKGQEKLLPIAEM